MTCPYCKHGLYLNDTPGLGPCACVTPERVEALERDVAAYQDQVAMAHSSRDDMEAERDEAREDLKEGLADYADLKTEVADAWRELGYDDAPEDRTLSSAIETFVAERDDETLADAADALRDYLTSQGLPAAPVRLADPALDRLADLLLT